MTKEHLAQAWSLDENFYKVKGAAAAALGAGPAHAAIEDPHAAALGVGPAIEDVSRSNFGRSAGARNIRS